MIPSMIPALHSGLSIAVCGGDTTLWIPSAGRPFPQGVVQCITVATVLQSNPIKKNKEYNCQDRFGLLFLDTFF
jgi:hypothetical protein